MSVCLLTFRRCLSYCAQVWPHTANGTECIARWLVDTSPPDIGTIVCTTCATSIDGTVAHDGLTQLRITLVNFSDRHSDIERFEVEVRRGDVVLSNGTLAPNASEVTFDGVPGVHSSETVTVEVAAVNYAGLSTLVGLPILIDNVPPAPQQVSACAEDGEARANGIFYQRVAGPLRACWAPNGFSDNASGLCSLEWRLWSRSVGRGGAWTMSQGRFDGANMTAANADGQLVLENVSAHGGEYWLHVHGTDCVGNHATFEREQGVPYVVDTEPPPPVEASLCDPHFSCRLPIQTYQNVTTLAVRWSFDEAVSIAACASGASGTICVSGVHDYRISVRRGADGTVVWNGTCRENATWCDAMGGNATHAALTAVPLEHGQNYTVLVTAISGAAVEGESIDSAQRLIIDLTPPNTSAASVLDLNDEAETADVDRRGFRKRTRPHHVWCRVQGIHDDQSPASKHQEWKLTQQDAAGGGNESDALPWTAVDASEDVAGCRLENCTPALTLRPNVLYRCMWRTTNLAGSTSAVVASDGWTFDDSAPQGGVVSDGSAAGNDDDYTSSTVELPLTWTPFMETDYHNESVTYEVGLSLCSQPGPKAWVDVGTAQTYTIQLNGDGECAWLLNHAPHCTLHANQTYCAHVRATNKHGLSNASRSDGVRVCPEPLRAGTVTVAGLHLNAVGRNQTVTAH